MSTMTTSAPSRAEVTACARPCPREPPVIRATLPSSIPMMCLPSRWWAAGEPVCSAELAAGVDDVGDAGDVPPRVADQVEDRVRDVGRLDRRHRQLVERARRHLEVLPGGVLKVRAE